MSEGLDPNKLFEGAANEGGDKPLEPESFGKKKKASEVPAAKKEVLPPAGALDADELFADAEAGGSKPITAEEAAKMGLNKKELLEQKLKVPLVKGTEVDETPAVTRGMKKVEMRSDLAIIPKAEMIPAPAPAERAPNALVDGVEKLKALKAQIKKLNPANPADMKREAGLKKDLDKRIQAFIDDELKKEIMKDPEVGAAIVRLGIDIGAAKKPSGEKFYLHGDEEARKRVIEMVMDRGGMAGGLKGLLETLLDGPATAQKIAQEIMKIDGNRLAKRVTAAGRGISQEASRQAREVMTQMQKKEAPDQPKKRSWWQKLTGS